MCESKCKRSEANTGTQRPAKKDRFDQPFVCVCVNQKLEHKETFNQNMYWPKLNL